MAYLRAWSGCHQPALQISNEDSERRNTGQQKPSPGHCHPGSRSQVWSPSQPPLGINRLSRKSLPISGRKALCTQMPPHSPPTITFTHGHVPEASRCNRRQGSSPAGVRRFHQEEKETNQITSKWKYSLYQSTKGKISRVKWDSQNGRRLRQIRSLQLNSKNNQSIQVKMGIGFE